MFRKISSLLLILLSILAVLSNQTKFGYAVNQGKVFLGKEAYLRRDGSFSFNKPTSKTPYTIKAEAPIGEYLLSSWSQSIPSTIALENKYLFLFSIWANKTSGNATLFGRIYLSRSGIETFLFESSRSEQVIISPLNETLWQSKTNQLLDLLKNDILIFRLYLNVIISGIFFFGYDCKDYPSYISDPTETRYMRNDEVLGTSQTSSYDSILVDTEFSITTIYYGIRVWKVHSNSTTTEITSGSSVAIAFGTGSGLLSGTWNCIQTPLVSTDHIRVIVYWGLDSSPGDYVQTFDTEDLGGIQLDASTWTVYYYQYRTKVGSSYYYYFRYGTSTYNSRIENFQWSTAKNWNIVETWSFSLITRQWLNIEIWNYQLISRLWRGIEIWNFNLETMNWQTIETWSLNIITSLWNTVEIWLINLNTSSWKTIEIWLFNLNTSSWKSIETWTFNLVSLGWHFVETFQLSFGYSYLIPYWILFLLGVLILIAYAVSRKL